MPTTLWAMLVGVDRYQSPELRQLNGCQNDAEAMRLFLLNQMHVPAGNIAMLVNEQATRKAFLDTFRTHLIENPQIQRGDQILFHYSGHGSQMRSLDPAEPDGWDETLVVHDSRMPGIFDIPDKTVGALLDKLAAAKSGSNAASDNITVILDCCHSGSGTRGLDDGSAALARLAPADDRLPPPDLDADIRSGAATRGAVPTQSGWAITHLLLAGCLDYQESYEYPAPEGVSHGALTYFTLDYLRTAPPNATYGDLYARVKPQVNQIYSRQTPQCEGNRKRVIFGGAVIDSDPFLPVRAEGTGVRLEGGIVHGLRSDAELAVYGPEVKTRTEAAAGEPLATVKVTAVSATTAQAAYLKAPAGALPVDAHALLTKQVYAGVQQRVLLAPAATPAGGQALDALREAVENAGGPGRSSPYLILVQPDQPADLQVTADQGQLTIRNERGETLVTPTDFTGPANATSTRAALESISRFRAVRGLADESSSKVQGKVKIGLFRWTDDHAEEVDLVQQALEQGRPLVLPYDPAGGERNRYLVKVFNGSNLMVYPHLFYLGPDFSVARLYPDRHQQERLEAGRTLACPQPGLNGYSFEFYLPGDNPGEEYWDRSVDGLKLVLTTQPGSLDLEQPALEVPPPGKQTRGAGASALDQLLDAATTGTRHQRPVVTGEQEDWGTDEVSFGVERTAAARNLAAPAEAVSLIEGMVLEKPAGFTGTLTVNVLSQVQQARGVGPGTGLPPLLAAQQTLFQPLVRSSQTRGTAGEPIVLTLEIDEVSRKSITQNNPLRLRVPGVQVGDDFMPVVFDGEDYLPVGYMDEASGAVEIVELPQSVAAAAPGEAGARGVGHAIKMFILKKSGRFTDAIGLRYAELVEDAADPKDAILYTPLQKERFQAGDSVALFVHGFTADSGSLMREVVPYLRGNVMNYTHLLAYDYETFGSGVEQNGDVLAQALRNHCGFHANDGITVHVYAHSMGTLVARCMVELYGGHEFVDRVVLAGPPNNGTALASLTRGFAYLLAALLNNLSQVPLAGNAGWVVREFYDQGLGWEDLKTASEITRKLNGLQAPDEVPYLVLAGNNEFGMTHGDRISRLAHKLFDRGLDTLFGERDNDAVIGMSSMKDLRGGAYPKLIFEPLPCDHFGYFRTEEGRKAMVEWFRKG